MNACRETCRYTCMHIIHHSKHHNTYAAYAYRACAVPWCVVWATGRTKHMQTSESKLSSDKIRHDKRM